MNLDSFNSMRKESDRAAAVLGAAFLDSALGELFESRCRPRVTADMLRANGVLGTFSNRIRMAYAIGWIAEDTHHDLHIVRKIRNEFAHHQDHSLSFATPSIADTARELLVLRAVEDTVATTVTSPIDDALRERLERFKPPRVRFDLAIMVLTDVIEVAKGDPAVASTDARSAVAFAKRSMENVLRSRPT